MFEWFSPLFNAQKLWFGDMGRVRRDFLCSFVSICPFICELDAHFVTLNEASKRGKGDQNKDVRDSYLDGGFVE